MRARDIGIGTIILIFLIVFALVLLRSCGGQSATSDVSITTQSLSPTEHLTECTPDPATGACHPQEKHLDEGFDWRTFMAEVRAASILGGTASSSFSSVRSVSAGDSACLTISGSGAVRSSNSRSRVAAPPGGTVVTIIDGSGGGGGGGTGGGTGGGGVGGGQGSLQGSTGTLPSGKCRDRSLLASLGWGRSTGETGWTFPVLIDGDCPISAAMLQWRKTGPFGGRMDDF